MPKVKGSTLRTRRQFVMRHHGEDAWSRVLERLTREQAADCGGVIVASSWYPFDTLNRLEDAIVDVCGAGDEKICVDIGAFSANENLSTLYRSYRADGENPGSFYRRLTQLYPTLYDFGRVGVVEPIGRNELRLVHDFEGHATRTNCLTALGFFQGAGVAAGIAGLKVDEPACQAWQDPKCILVLSFARPRRKTLA